MIRHSFDFFVTVWICLDHNISTMYICTSCGYLRKIWKNSRPNLAFCCVFWDEFGRPLWLALKLSNTETSSTLPTYLAASRLDNCAIRACLMRKKWHSHHRTGPAWQGLLNRIILLLRNIINFRESDLKDAIIQCYNKIIWLCRPVWWHVC